MCWQMSLGLCISDAVHELQSLRSGWSERLAVSQQPPLAAGAMLTARQPPFKLTVKKKGGETGVHPAHQLPRCCLAGAALAAQQPLPGTAAQLGWPSLLGSEPAASQPEGSSQGWVTGAEQAAAAPGRDAARQLDLVDANPGLSSGGSTSSGTGGTMSTNKAGLR